MSLYVYTTVENLYLLLFLGFYFNLTGSSNSTNMDHAIKKGFYEAKD